MVYRKPYNYDQVLRRGPCLIIYLLPSLDKMLEPEANDLRPAICLLFYQRHGRKNKWHRNGLGVFLVFYPDGVEVHVARGGCVRHLSPVDLAVEAPPLRQRPAVQLRPPAVARGVDDEPRVVAVAVGLPARELHRPAGEAQRRRRRRAPRPTRDSGSCRMRAPSRWRRSRTLISTCNRIA